MSDRQRILVVTGSRTFEADDRSRAWARRAMLGAFHLVGPSVVVHGGAPGWDLYAEHLALFLGLPRIVFALGPRQLIAEPRLHLPGGTFRAVKDARAFELPTQELEVPSEAWPAGSDDGT